MTLVPDIEMQESGKMVPLNLFAAMVHLMNVNKGFYDSYFELLESLNQDQQKCNQVNNYQTMQCLALIVSEVTEAMEELRHGKPESTKVPGVPEFELELADIFIRLLDLVAFLDIDIQHAITRKIEYNSNRPYKHSKKF